MNATLLQAKIYQGYADAAIRLGTLYSQYRPSGVSAPIASGNLLGTILVAFDAAASFNFGRPALYAKPVWYALLDGTQTVVGDYLVGEAGTYFIAAQEPLLPIAAVLCNRTVSVLRPAGNTGVGAQPYGGDTAATETPVMTTWPASILQGTKGEKGDVALPGDIRQPWYAILLPAWPGVLIDTADVLNDDLGRRMKVSGAELTNLGWRLTAELALT